MLSSFTGQWVLSGKMRLGSFDSGLPVLSLLLGCLAISKSPKAFFFHGPLFPFWYNHGIVVDASEDFSYHQCLRI